MKSFSNHVLLAFVFCMSVMVAVGCEDGTADQPAAEQGGDESGEVTTEGAGLYTYAAEKALCLAQASQDAGLCAECPCVNCIAELSACNSDEGCTEMLACKQQTGCSGTDCLEPDVCGGLLDKYPGGVLSYAAQLTNAFFECLRLSCYDVCAL